MPTCYSPVRHSPRRLSEDAPRFSFDSHSLGTPPAFVLSQDQTLHRKAGSAPRPKTPAGGYAFENPSSSNTLFSFQGSPSAPCGFVEYQIRPPPVKTFFRPPQTPSHHTPHFPSTKRDYTGFASSCQPLIPELYLTHLANRSNTSFPHPPPPSSTIRRAIPSRLASSTRGSLVNLVKLSEMSSPTAVRSSPGANSPSSARYS